MATEIEPQGSDIFAEKLKKGQKPPPETGPGSRIIALALPIQRRIKRLSKIEVEMRFSTLGIKMITREIFENEEILEKCVAVRNS